MRHYAELSEAVNAFLNADEPYKQIVFDDGWRVRELNHLENGMLVRATQMLAFEIDEIEG